MAQNMIKTNPEKSVSGRDSAFVTKRLQGELMRFMMSKTDGISAFPDGDNLRKWIGTISGPDGTVYEKLSFKLSLEFPPDYPYVPPNVRFLTPCFHPNVDLSNGAICLDILKDKWSALLEAPAVLLSIQSLLGEPNNQSPLNQEAARLWPNQKMFKTALLEAYKSNPREESRE